MQELGWNNFQERTNYLSITMFGKIKLTQTPRIIYNTFFLDLPANIGRNIGKLKIIFSKKKKFYNSYYFKMIRMWNTLPIETRKISNYPDFLEIMHQKYFVHAHKKTNIFHYDTEIDNIYLKLRSHCSNLQADQFKFNFVQNSICQKCNKNKQETVHQYFLDCNAYQQQRQILKTNISSLHTQLKNLTNKQIINIIHGARDDKIDKGIYKSIYQFIKLYIVTTGKFA